MLPDLPHFDLPENNSDEFIKITSSHSKGETVILSELSVDEGKIQSIIDKTGYKVLGYKSGKYSGKSGILGKLFSK